MQLPDRRAYLQSCGARRRAGAEAKRLVTSEAPQGVLALGLTHAVPHAVAGRTPGPLAFLVPLSNPPFPPQAQGPPHFCVFCIIAEPSVAPLNVPRSPDS